MDMQTLLNNSMVARRKESLSKSEQLTLGEIILKLEPIVEKQLERIQNEEEEATVWYDFEYLHPTSIDSWRGSYSELALNYENEETKPMTVTLFLKMLKETIGKEFTGYKGGEFVMSKHTPVWVANYGNSGNTGVLDILDKEYEVVIITGYCEY